jgi:CHAT domain-containing protein/tetratricopeptide (TPR) repeat protein
MAGRREIVVALTLAGIPLAGPADPVRAQAIEGLRNLDRRLLTVLTPNPLTPGQSVTRTLAPDERHAYELTLSAGEALDLEVDQQGIDVIVSVLGPDGRMDEVDDLAEHENPERIRLLAEAPGSYHLIVHSEPLPGVEAGRYRIGVGSARPASDVDRQCRTERQQRAEQLAAASARLMEVAKGATPAVNELIQLEASLDAVMAFSEANRQSRQLATARRFKSLLLLLANRDREVVAINEQRLAWLVGARSRGERAHALNHMADGLTRTGETRRAYEAYQEALTLPLSPHLEAITHDNIGYVLGRMGRLQESLDAHVRALAYFRKAGPRRSEAVVLSRLAGVWNEVGELTRALEVQQEALDVYRSIDDRISEARGLNLRAAWLLENGDVDAARAAVERAQTLNDVDQVPINTANTNEVLAKIHEARGEYSKAIELAARSHEQFRSLGFHQGEATTLVLLAAAHLAEGRPDEARTYATRAAAASEASRIWTIDADARVVLARAARVAGNLDAAREHVETALERIERARATLGGAELRTSLTARYQELYEEHADLLMALHRSRPGDGFDRVALEASELSRARSLLDVLTAGAAEIRGRVDGALLDRERDLRLRLDDKDVLARDARAEGRTFDAARLDREMAALAADLQLVDSQIAANSPAFSALTRPRSLSAHRIQGEVLDADTVLLEYSVGKERSWLWGVTATEIVTFELPGRTAIEPLVRNLLELLTTRQRRDPRVGSAESLRRVKAADVRLEGRLSVLGQTLLGPVAARLRGDWRRKRLVVVASGPLQYVPFAALRIPNSADSPDAGPRPRLVDDHEVVTAPSASVIGALRQEPDTRRADPGAAAGPQARRSTLAIVADPVFDASDPRVRRPQQPAADRRPSHDRAGDMPSVAQAEAERVLAGVRGGQLARLPFSRGEAQALLSLVPPGAATVTLDFAANRAWANAAPLGRYRILHFATHALIDTRQPQLSSIVLSLVDEQGRPRNGFLRMHDIYNRELPVDLVVLSACQTALGREVRGEGLVGLTRGFMYAGARRVVASLWQVDDQATAELMTRFYRHMLRGGRRPAAALRAAQRELAGYPRWAAPYFWAGFVIQGEWR